MGFAMSLFDPTVCGEAFLLIEQGRIGDAAQVLLDAAKPLHKSVQRMLGDVTRRLIEQAQRDADNGLWELAGQSIELAGRCAELPAEGRVLRDHISQEIQRLQAKRAWQAGQLVEAEKLAHRGRLKTAVEIAAQLDSDASELLQQELKQRLERFERYVAETRQHIEQEEPEIARQRLRRAQELIPVDPEVLRLWKILYGEIPETPAPFNRNANGLHANVSTPAFRQRAHADAFVSESPLSMSQQYNDCRGITLGSEALVVCGSGVVIGSLKEDVEIPLLANVKRRHARLVRIRAGYTISPIDAAELSINGQRVRSLHPLREGDRIELGSSGSVWRFLIPVPGSLTAVLQSEPGSVGAVRLYTGQEFQRVVLMADRLEVAAYGAAHVVIPRLPCERVTLFRSGDQWRVRVFGGFVGDPMDGVAERDMTVSDDLTLHGDLDLAELQARLLMRLPPGETSALPIRNAYRSKAADT